MSTGVDSTTEYTTPPAGGGGGTGTVTSVTAGAGMTQTGTSTINPTVNVIANADASIVVNADDIQVGVLATDAQHGVRGGGTLHVGVIAGGAAGFMSGTDKAKLDGITGITGWKEAVRVASIANLTLSGTQTIDGVACIAGDRVLAKDQTTGADNGIYVVAAGAWARSTDADSSAEVKAGMVVFVSEGTANGGSFWRITTNDPIVLGTTALAYANVVSFTRVSLALSAATGAVGFNNQKLSLVADPSAAQDVATKTSSEAVVTAARVITALGSAASSVSVNTQKITNVVDPAAAQDAATKTSSEAVVTEARVRTALAALTTAPAFNGKTLSSVADPVSAQDAATKTSSEAVVTEARVRAALAAAGAAINVNAQNIQNIAQVGIGTAVPTHALTLATGSTMAIYNTADQTTNYERCTVGASSSLFQLTSGIGGTGTLRSIRLNSGGSLTVNQGGTFQLSGALTTGTSDMVSISNSTSWSSTVAVQAACSIGGTVNQASGSGGWTGLLINPTLTAVGSAGANLLRLQAGSVDKLRIDSNGKITQDATITAAGTTGAQTINKPAGTVNFAAGATSLVVTNSLCTVNSLPMAWARTNDTTGYVKSVVPAAGSFTITLGASATAEISVGFVMEN